MKRLAIFITVFLLAISSYAAVKRGSDGRWYGNMCITQLGWEEVSWQLVGSMCYAPMRRQYGFIANT